MTPPSRTGEDVAVVAAEPYPSPLMEAAMVEERGSNANHHPLLSVSLRMVVVVLEAVAVAELLRYYHFGEKHIVWYESVSEEEVEVEEEGE